MSQPKAKAERVPKLTKTQMAMLDRICRTNGGGVFAGFTETACETRLLFRLAELGLVQGKSGNLAFAVHTPKGLAMWRAALQAKAG